LFLYVTLIGGHGCREYFEDVNNTRVKFEQTLWGHIRNFFQLAKERCLLQVSINPGIILILVTHDKRDVAFDVDMASKWPSLGLILALLDITSNRVQLISLFMAICSPQTLVRALRYSNAQALSLYLLKEL